MSELRIRLLKNVSLSLKYGFGIVWISNELWRLKLQLKYDALANYISIMIFTIFLSSIQTHVLNKKQVPNYVLKEQDSEGTSLPETVPWTLHNNELMEIFSYLENCSILNEFIIFILAERLAANGF